MCVCMYDIFLIHSPVDIHLDCFHTLTIINKVILNIGEHLSRFFGYIPRSGIAGSYDNPIFSFLRNLHIAPLVAQMVKNLPAMWETWIQSLGWEDPLEESMATHSSILAWRIPWTEEPGGLQSTGLQRIGWLSIHSAQHILLSIVAAQSYISTNSVCGFPLLHILAYCYLCSFWW